MISAYNHHHRSTKEETAEPVGRDRSLARRTTRKPLTVTLTPRKTLVLNPPLKLTISASALLDAQNRPLDGSDSGQPGANYVATIKKSGFTVNS